MGSTLAAAKIFKSDLLAFCATIPFNLYAILTILMVIILACTNISYGPMRKIEKYAELNNELGALTFADKLTATSFEMRLCKGFSMNISTLFIAQKAREC